MGVVYCCEGSRQKPKVDLDAKLGNGEFVFPGGGLEDTETIDYFIKNWKLKEEVCLYH